MNNTFSDDADDVDAIEIIDLDTLEQDHPNSEKIHLPSRPGQRPAFQLHQTPMRLSMLALTLVGCIFLLTALWPAIALNLSPFLVWHAPVPPTPTALSLTSVLPNQQRYVNVVTGNGVAYIYSYAFQNPNNAGSLDAVNVKSGTYMWGRKNINVLTPPVLVKNVLYLASRDGIYALRARDGALLWHQNIGQYIICTFNGILYTNEGTGKQTGAYALRMSNGSILWYNSSVILAHIANTCSASTKVLIAASPTEKATVALNIANGLVLWQYQTSLLHTNQVNTVTNIVSDYDQPAKLEGIDPTGTVSWHYDTKQLWSTDEGDLYIQQSDGSVAALRPNDGSVVWQQSMIEGIQAKDNGVLYTSFNTSLYLRHANDGSELLNAGNVGPNPIFVQNGMCFIPIPGVLVIVDTRTSVHMFSWHTSVNGQVMTISGGIIYLSTDLQDEPIAALRASDGKMLWHYTISDRSEQNDYFINADADTVYISSSLYGTVTALRSGDGTQLWSYHLLLSA